MKPLDYLPEIRREKLLEHLEEHGTLRVPVLSDLLGVAPVTIRRDIALLAKQGAVKRIRGGIQLPAADTNANRKTRSETDRTIGLLVPRLDYYWPDVVRGAEEAAADGGAKVVLRESAYGSPEADLAQIHHLVESAGVDGLLLAVNIADDPARLLEAIENLDVPSVLVERRLPKSFQDSTLDSVASDHAHGANLAVRHLEELGHTRIGIVVAHGGPTGPILLEGWSKPTSKKAKEIQSGIKEALQLEPLDNTSTHEVFAHILRACEQTDTTGLLIHADAEANAFVQYCQERNIRIPEDMSIVAYDDELASLFSPKLSAIRPPRLSIGLESARLLLSRLDDPDLPARRLLISPRLNVRDSTAPPKRH